MIAQKKLVLIYIAALALLFFGCGKVPIKQYYEINYLPGPLLNRQSIEPYDCIVRLKEFDIEEAYNRSQIVYRQSPFELRYYVYRVWAVKPAVMVTRLFNRHMSAVNLVNSVIRRFDEGVSPDYEISGMIEALEEYDSEDLWFAHLALRVRMARLSDGKTIYNRRFDIRKKVAIHDPELVIREISALAEFAITQAIQDIDIKLAQEFNVLKPINFDSTKSPLKDSLIIERTGQ
jgi:ABC-type uncharacterized transport system auxiliary subunit